MDEYYIIENFIPETEAANHARGLLGNNGYQVDDLCPLSKSFSNPIEQSKLLVKTTPRVSEIIGEPVLPTYAYARIYSHNETLVKHTDREACELTVTLNLARCCEWPLYLDTPNSGIVEVIQNPGDALIYSGIKIPHWREQYHGNQHIQVFLHYVREYGPYTWAVFDRERRETQTAKRLG